MGSKPTLGAKKEGIMIKRIVATLLLVTLAGCTGSYSFEDEKQDNKKECLANEGTFDSALYDYWYYQNTSADYCIGD